MRKRRLTRGRADDPSERVMPPPRRRQLARIALLAAVGVAVLSYPLRARWWGGLLLAVGEAGIVGGLADWFAVTALFRRPLGLPIPHTALIPANWQLMATRVGRMVGDRVLTTAYMTREISRVDLAGWLGRAAAALAPEDMRAAVGAISRWAATELPSASTRDLAAWLRRLLLDGPVSPLLADAVELALCRGWDHRLVDALGRELLEALDRPTLRQALGELVDGVLAGYRERIGVYPGFLIGVAGMLGLIDRDRLVSALDAALVTIVEDPDHPLRRRLSETLGELPSRLRTDPDLRARVEAVKVEILSTPELAAVTAAAVADLLEIVSADLGRPESSLVAWLSGEAERARHAIAGDEALRRQLDGWLKARASALVARYQDRVGAFIERGVRALGPEGAVRLIEEHAGDDLQYIRVNGTVVGGLAGGALYGVHLLLRLLA